jgi:hypothetical protein
MPAQGLTQVVNIVGREPISAHYSQVAGEVDKQPEQLAVRRLRRQHADVWVDRPGRLYDLGISELLFRAKRRHTSRPGIVARTMLSSVMPGTDSSPWHPRMLAP